MQSTGLAPPELRTPLESPQLEKRTCFSVMSAHTAVVPLLSSPLATSGILRNFSSSSRKPFRMPVLTYEPDDVALKFINQVLCCFISK